MNRSLCWVSCLAQSGLVGETRVLPAGGAETLTAHRLLGNWIQVPHRRPFVLKLSNLPRGLFQAEECVILGFYELTELPLSKGRGEMDQR